MSATRSGTSRMSSSASSGGLPRCRERRDSASWLSGLTRTPRSHPTVDEGAHLGLLAETSVGWIAFVSSTTPRPSGRETSKEVPVKPVCHKVASGHRPQSRGESRQPDPRTSSPVPALLGGRSRRALRGEHPAVGVSKCRVKARDRRSVRKDPAWPATPPRAWRCHRAPRPTPGRA